VDTKFVAWVFWLLLFVLPLPLPLQQMLQLLPNYWRPALIAAVDFSRIHTILHVSNRLEESQSQHPAGPPSAEKIKGSAGIPRHSAYL